MKSKKNIENLHNFTEKPSVRNREYVRSEGVVRREKDILYKKVEPHSDFAGVYWITLTDGKKRLATKNLAPGKGVYGEHLVSFRGNEYRIWDPYRSKLAAVILNGLNFTNGSPWKKEKTN